MLVSSFWYILSLIIAWHFYSVPEAYLVIEDDQRAELLPSQASKRWSSLRTRFTSLRTTSTAGSDSARLKRNIIFHYTRKHTHYKDERSRLEELALTKPIFRQQVMKELEILEIRYSREARRLAIEDGLLKE